MHPKPVVADLKNRIFEVDGMAAAGMKAGSFYPLVPEELIPLPFASELFVLKDRAAVGFEGAGLKSIRAFNGTRCFPVAAFVSPGYTTTFSAAYQEERSAKLLPLFSYAAISWYKGKFYAAATRVELERRQDLRLMNMAFMHKNVARFKKMYPGNRLIRHLSGCACTYGCPAATNFFLERYECPLPTSPSCNSACIGCISVKHSSSCPEVQPRIRFIPSPQEIAQVALHHIKVVDNPVVSFGQGCEGEPLIVADVLEEAIRLIRKETKKGVINLNTNASRPDKILRLREAGLDSMRVSVNSARKKFYDFYYNPKGYKFSDVILSIEIMKRLGGFVSINYLVMPGFTDQKEEAVALFDFIRKTRIDMIQWRNLNYDPMEYFRKLKIKDVKGGGLLGIKQLIEKTRKVFPKLRHGYFNPREI